MTSTDIQQVADCKTVHDVWALRGQWKAAGKLTKDRAALLEHRERQVA